jgi:hypothetical protein
LNIDVGFMEWRINKPKPVSGIVRQKTKTDRVNVKERIKFENRVETKNAETDQT